MDGNGDNPQEFVVGNVDFQTVKTALTEAQDLILQAKSAGVDVSDIEQVYREAKPALEQNDFARAYDIAINVKQAVEGRIETMPDGSYNAPPIPAPGRDRIASIDNSGNDGSIDKKTAMGTLKEAKKALGQAKKDGIDIKAAAAKFKEAKPFLAAKDYHSAYLVGQEVLSLVEQSRQSTTNAQDPRKIEAENQIMSLQTTMSQAEQAGMDVSNIQPVLENASNAYNSGDYESAITVATEGLNLLQPQPDYQEQPVQEFQEVQQDYQEQPVQEYQEVQQDYQEQPVQEYQEVQQDYQESSYTAKDAKERILEARNRLRDVKKAGMDISELQSVFMEAKPALSAGDFAGAYAIAEQVIQMADQMLGITPAQTGDADMAAEAWDIIEYLRSNNVNVSDYEAAMKQVEEMINAGNPDGTQITKDTLDQLKIKRSEVNSELAEEELNMARTAASQCADKGFDVQNITEEIMSAENALQAGNFDEAVDRARNARNMAENIEKYNECVAAVESAKSNLQYLENRGINVQEAKDILKEAKAAMARADYDGVLEICRRTEEKAEEIKEGAIVSLVNSMIIDLRKDLAFLTEEGAETSEIEENLKEAEKLSSENKYEEASKKAQKAKDISDAIMEKYLSKRAMNAIIQIQSELATARDDDIDVKDAEAIFEEARASYEKKEFKEVLEATSKVERMIINARKKRELVAILKETKEKMAEARATGADISHAEDIFNSVKPAVKEQDFDRAMELALKARKDAEEALLQHDVFKLVETLQKRISEGKSMGLDTTAAEEGYNRTREALEENDFEGAYSIATQAQLSIDKQIEAHREAEDTINKLDAEISDLKAMGIRSPMGEGLLDEAKTALEQLNYQEVKDKCEEVSKHLEDSEKRYNEAFEAIQKAQTKMGEAKKMGASIKQASAIFSSVPQALDDANYEEAAKYAQQAEEAAILSKQRYERSFDVVSLAQKRISEAKKIGADVSIAENIMKQIPAALDDGDYDKVMELARKAEKQAEEAKKLTEQLVDLLQMTKEKIETYKKKGADVRDAEKLFNQMIASIDRHDLEEAMQIGESALESVERARLIHEQLVEEIKTAQKNISEAKGLGVDVSKAMATFNQIPIARNSGDFAKAIALAKEARVSVEESLKKFNALKIIQDTFQKVNDAKKIGSDVSTSEELLAQARASLKLEDYDGAIKLAKQSATELATRLLGEDAASMGM